MWYFKAGLILFLLWICLFVFLKWVDKNKEKPNVKKAQERIYAFTDKYELSKNKKENLQIAIGVLIVLWLLSRWIQLPPS